MLWTSSGHFELAEYHFYAALARARRHDDATPEEQAEQFRELVEHHARLATWAEHCPRLARITAQREYRVVRREMAAGWLKLTDISRDEPA